MNDLLIAKNKLSEGYTLVLCKNKECLTSSLNGIRPLLGYLKDNLDLKDYSVADKIIGKAQAMLIVKAQIKYAYGEVMSTDAKELLTKYNVYFEYNKLVDKIINREGTDICPMEKTVQNIDDIEEAYIALDKKVQELLSKSK